MIHGPRRAVTTEWPSPVEPSVVTVIGIGLALTTLAAAALADLGRWRLLPLLPLALASVLTIALGAPRPPGWWSLALLGLGGFVVGLLPPGEALVDRAATLAGDRTIVATLGAAVTVSIAVTAILASDGRADPRRVEQAETTSTVLDPIEATVALRRAEPPIGLLEIVDRSSPASPSPAGSSLPARWRLAALDDYDGERWVPEVTLRPIGGRLGLAPTLEPGGDPITYEVVYLTDDLELVPVPGRPLAVDTPVETDVDRVAVRLLTRPGPGTRVTATSLVSPSTADPTAGFAGRPADGIAATFADEARMLAGDGSVIDQLRAIETTMRTEWVLDRDVAGGGQQLALLERFVSDTRRGTREQFVTTFVLFARALGVDARVATGFVVPPEASTSPLVIDSTHAASWPEVRLVGGHGLAAPGEGHGLETSRSAEWLAFDPVPPPSEVADDERPDPPDAQSPAAAQPPIEPPSDDADDDDETTVAATSERSRWDTIVRWAGGIGVGASIGLLPLAAVIASIGLLKWRRQQQRIRHPEPVHRIRGAWANVTDGLVDAGLTIGPAWTDDRIARHGAPLAPSVPHELRRLAAMATAVTFGHHGDAWRLADDAISTSRSIDAALRADRTRWQRVRWRLSLRSLRTRTRSPVMP